MKEKRNKTTSLFKNINFYILMILIIITAVFIYQTFSILPLKYWLPMIVILILFCGLMYFFLFSKRINKFNRILGKIILVFLCFGLIIGNFAVYKYGATIRSITGANKQTNEISVIVLKDDDAKKITDLKGSTFGIQEEIDRTNTDYAIDLMEKDMGSSADIKGFTSNKSQVDALYDGSVRAIVMNEFSRQSIEEENKNFSSETRVIKTYKKTTQVEKVGTSVDVTKDPFTIFISGIDTYGPVSTVSRSDVNMLMSVNPTTKQILLISIPRDFYVPFACLNGTKDKLTHAGIYGVGCSVDTLNDLFDTEINYYGRVNFTSLIKIVDALDGIVVDNPVAFSTGSNNFGAGSISLNGEQALAFSRDRYHQEGGDRGRGKNQMRVITGIINKSISSKMITNFNGIMESIAGSFETNMESSDINRLVQMQLDKGGSWNITQISVDGTGGTDFAYSLGDNAYVMYPTQSTVDNAINMINQVEQGGIPNQ